MRYLYLFLLIAFSAHSQTDLIKGAVIPEMDMESNKKQTYAVYLPRTYDLSKTYPAVFVFDTEGRGASAVQQFTIAAALTESIIIGANYKLDNELEVSFKQVTHLITRVKENYAVDDSKIILSSNDDNNLLLSSFLKNTTDIYGIIAINNLVLNKQILSKNPTIKIAVISGDETPSFYTLQSYSNHKDYKDFIVDYQTYDGAGWPQAGYLSGALTSILISEVTPIEKVSEYYKSDIEFAELLYRRQKHLYAYDFVDHLKNKYKSILDINTQKELKKTIRNNATYKLKKSEKTIVNYSEKSLAQDFKYYLLEDSKNAFFDNLGWWSSQMDALDMTADSTAQSTQIRKSAIRLKAYVQDLVEQQYQANNNKNQTVEKSLFINILRTLVDPNNQEAFINVISLSAREADYNAAYFYLEELLKSGYSNYDMLYEIPYTNAILIGPEWNEIIKTYLGKSKYY